MHLSNERMLVILAVGALAGWLIGKVLRGNGFGLVGDAAIGIVGALIGDWLLPRFNFHFWSGLTGMIIEVGDWRDCPSGCSALGRGERMGRRPLARGGSMFKHILIPTDGSDLSRKAILYGVQLAKELERR